MHYTNTVIVLVSYLLINVRVCNLPAARIITERNFLGSNEFQKQRLKETRHPAKTHVLHARWAHELAKEANHAIEQPNYSYTRMYYFM